MHRVAEALLVALAVVVFGIAGYVVVHGTNVKGAGTTPPDAALSAQPSTPSASSPGSSTGAPAHRLVAFLGDDWTVGTGASSPAKGFVPLLGSALQIDAKTFGAKRAGYANAGEDAKTYADLVPAVVKAGPDVVVVTGGRNDNPDYEPTAAKDATALFAELHRDLPQATLVAVAPWWGDSDLPAATAKLGTAVKAAVHAVDGHYIALPDPIHGHPSDMADAAHPDDAGYAAIAQALAPKLRPLLAQS